VSGFGIISAVYRDTLFWFVKLEKTFFHLIYTV